MLKGILVIGLVLLFWSYILVCFGFKLGESPPSYEVMLESEGIEFIDNCIKAHQHYIRYPEDIAHNKGVEWEEDIIDKYYNLRGLLEKKGVN